jgi:hypothetical protein
MRKDKMPASPESDAVEEHRLVAELRDAMASKDIITMGRMLELLSTIRGELAMGKPIIDTLAAPKSEPSAGGAPSKARKPGPAGAAALRATR